MSEPDPAEPASGGAPEQGTGGIPAPAAEETLRPRKQHPSAIAFDLLRSARGFLVPGLMVLIFARGDRRELWLMVLFVPVTLVQLVRYWTLRYEVRAGELVLSEGLLNRNVRNIPLERVQDIDTRQGPLHRLFGVASVRLRTATDGTPEVELSALRLAAIEELRHALVASRRRLGGPAVRTPDPASDPASDPDAGVADEAAEDAPRRELHLAPGALVKLALVRNRGLLAIGALFAFLGQYGLLDRLDDLNIPGLEQLDSLPPAAQLGLRVLLFAFSLFALAVLSPLLSIPWTLLRYGDFRLQLDGDDLRIEKGWWTRSSISIPRARIQRVSVVESPLQRLFGVVSIHAVNAGRAGDDGNATGTAELVPILDRELAEPFLAAFVPDFRWSDAWRRPHPRARTRLRRRAWIRALVVGGFGTWLFGPGALVPAVLYLLLVDWSARRRAGWLAWQRSGVRVASREGAFVRRTIVAPIQKLQTLVQRESPFDRRWNMRHAVLDTAGGSSVNGLELAFLEREDCAALSGELVLAVDASRFRW